MEIEFILYVANQAKSSIFYAEIFQQKPELDVPGMTEFKLRENIKLGLMPETGIAKILSDKVPHPSSGNGIPRCELYLKTNNAPDLYKRAIKAGAINISEPLARDWGDVVSYVADLDGHVLAFAQNI